VLKYRKFNLKKSKFGFKPATGQSNFNTFVKFYQKTVITKQFNSILFVKIFDNFKIRFVLFLAALVVVFTACEEYSSIGVEVLPGGDLISIHNRLIKDDISAFTFTDDSMRTDEASNSLLGSLNDPLFGVTTIDFASQFRLLGYPYYGPKAKLDSIKLYLYYRVLYGDTATKQKFAVYELKSSIDPDKSYYQDVDLKSLAYDKLIGQIEYKPKVKLDSLSKDTFYQLINIPLDMSLGQKIFNASPSDLVSNDAFLEYFKGLYIETAKINNKGGTILSLETISSGNFSGSAVVLFYHNDSIKTTAGKDSAQLMPFIISKYSARVNRFVHDYQKTAFYSDLNQETNPDSLIYVQATGGLKSRILIDDLTSWKDSTNTAINKAELIFTLDTLASQHRKFPPPNQLLFTVVDSKGVERLPIDYGFSPSLYGGYLAKDYTYSFLITQQIQEIIDGRAENFGFYLTPALKNNQANRVVLKGSTSKIGIKLSITYSKYTTN